MLRFVKAIHEEPFLTPFTECAGLMDDDTLLCTYPPAVHPVLLRLVRIYRAARAGKS